MWSRDIWRWPVMQLRVASSSLCDILLGPNLLTLTLVKKSSSIIWKNIKPNMDFIRMFMVEDEPEKESYLA